MRVAIIGATQGIGRAIARQLAARGDHLCLLGRDPGDLRRSADDLQIRASENAPQVSVVQFDLRQYAGAPATSNRSPTASLPSASEAIARARETLSGLDAVICTAGAFGTPEALEADQEHCARVLDTNFTATVLFCEAARDELLRSGGGSLVVLSSVAGDVPRRKVGIYGATKAGLSYYLQTLSYRYRPKGLHVLNVKPGFVRTAMTHGLKPPPFAGHPESVGKDIIRALDKKKTELYTPAPWRLVMAILKRLPSFIMRRLSF